MPTTLPTDLTKASAVELILALEDLVTGRTESTIEGTATSDILGELVYRAIQEKLRGNSYSDDILTRKD